MILLASGALVKTVSALLSCSSVESNKYFLTHIFWMYKARKYIFRLQPLCQIFWALSNNSKRGCMSQPWLQRLSSCYLPDQSTEEIPPCKSLPWDVLCSCSSLSSSFKVHRVVVSISCKSACKYLALLKIRHQVPVLHAPALVPVLVFADG